MFLKFLLLFLMYLWLCDGALYNDRYRSLDRQSNNAKVMRPRPTICTPPKFYNGNIIPLRNGKMIKFECKKGYIREGEHYVTCKGGRWDVDVLPICIKGGCSSLARVDNGQINYINKKTTAMLICDSSYEAVGSVKTYCNGLVWDRAIGSCRETNNALPLECDFETEAICGYIHDTDNDLDFIRSSGYNSRIMTLATGPHADHTIGKPLEGHFMVIKTNAQFANKKARLISQSYNLTESKNICIRFFYHMYGYSVGKLRVYQKPTSLNFEDVLIESVEDDDDADKTKYLIFSKDGTQGNAWIEGFTFMKVLNESFQIVFEAVTGHTMMSDIAIDDISILLDDDCLIEDQATTPKMIEEDENIFDVQSCVGRCFNDNNTMIKIVNATLLCNCNDECLTQLTCCPDFIDVCSVEDNSTTIIFTTVTPTTIEATTILTTSTTVATPITVKVTTKATVPTTISTTTSTTTMRSTRVTIPTTVTTNKPTTVFIPPTTKRITQKPTTMSSTPRPTTIKQTIPSTTTTTTTSKPVVITKTTSTTTNAPEEFIGNKKSDDDEVLMKELSDEDYSSIEKITPQEMAEKSSLPLNQSNKDLLYIIVVSLGVITTIAVVAFVAIRRYKSSTNPLNYKQNRRKVTTKNVTEEFSEVRFLTEDECLDFNIANSESCLNSE